ncbi:MAG: ATP-binding protein [Candidatus Velthaea sp.]
MIGTLRARLVVATASLGIAIMLVFIVALTLIGGPLISRPIVDSVAAAAGDARQLVAAAPASENFDDLIRRVVDREMLRGVSVAIIPPPEAQHVRPGDTGPLSLARLIGLRGETVPVRGSILLLFPEPDAVDAAIRAYLLLVGGAVVVSLVLSLAAARWSAAQAVSPLLAVTGELERFAGGDFRERELQTRDRGEIGALTTAFNAAARQVAQSFAERARVEEEMRRFVADASHELRTPLTVVTGFVDVLRRGGYADENLRDNAFRRIATETKRMRQLVERLIVLARIERLPSVAPEIVDLAEIAREAIAARCAGGTAVPLAVTGETAYVRADPADLHEAIGNLIENALKYGVQPQVGIARENGTAVVRVQDAGPGIAAEDADKIFERFYRSAGSRETPGSGLGLTIAAGAAKRAGGTLVLEDPSAGHTTFALRLPLVVVR